MLKFNFFKNWIFLTLDSCLSPFASCISALASCLLYLRSCFSLLGSCLLYLGSCLSALASWLLALASNPYVPTKPQPIPLEPVWRRIGDARRKYSDLPKRYLGGESGIFLSNLPYPIFPGLLPEYQPGWFCSSLRIFVFRV